MSYLTELNVTEADLAELKRTNTIFRALSMRLQNILIAAKDFDDVWFCASNGKFVGLVTNAPIFPGHCYRLRPDLELPPSVPARREGNDPFEWEVDGRKIWCCPVFHETRDVLTCIRYRAPDNVLSPFPVFHAANFVEFLGVMTEDADGWPKKWVKFCSKPNRDISQLLAKREDLPFAFVCFRKG